MPDEQGAPFDADAYHAAVGDITARGGTPVVFPSHGLNGGSEEDWIAALATIGAEVDRFLGFELGAMFVPYGRNLRAGDLPGAARDPPVCGGEATHPSTGSWSGSGWRCAMRSGPSSWC